MTSAAPHDGGRDAPPAAWLDRLAELIATAPVNLVSQADRSVVRQVHLDECVRIGHRLAASAPGRWMDLGTGGGLPGLVLAHMFGGTRWTLVDARAKKVRQVQRFVRTLGLDNVEVVHARAEDLGRSPTHMAAYDGVISRAVGSLVRTIALARPFVAHGEMVGIRGPHARTEVAALAEWEESLAVSVRGVTPIDGTIRPTWLVRVRGLGPVPDAFTRVQRRILRSTQGGSSGGSA